MGTTKPARRRFDCYDRAGVRRCRVTLTDGSLEGSVVWYRPPLAGGPDVRRVDRSEAACLLWRWRHEGGSVVELAR
jgi:hypothetical protein